MTENEKIQYVDYIRSKLLSKELSWQEIHDYAIFIKNNNDELFAKINQEQKQQESNNMEKTPNITFAADTTANLKDNINPPHYTSHPSGVECIQITRHMSFNIGNAVKYLWRFEDKNGIEDLEKAIWYIKDEIERLKNAQTKR